jgi:hypothetical protein
MVMVVIHEKYTEGDLRDNEKGEEARPNNGQGLGWGSNMGVEQVGKLGVGYWRKKERLVRSSWSWLSRWAKEVRRLAGRRLGARLQAKTYNL